LPESLDAWECYQRGLWHLYRFRAEDSPKAQELFRRAIELDPNFAPAHAALGYALYFEVSDGLVSAPDDQITRALEAAKTAVALDERAAFGHIVLGRVLLAHGEFDASIAANATALAFNPNNANAHYGEGLAQCFAGRPEAAIAKVDEALRLSPHDPGAWNFMWLRSLSLTLLRSYDEAVDWARKAVSQPNATIWAHSGEAVALAHLGRIDEARVALDRALAIKPDLSTDDFGSFLPWKNPEHLAHYAEGLHKAGLPE
jgi:adenylate cyclase